MINLFFVEAPFQLIAAIESAKTLVGCKNTLILRKNGHARNDAQLEEMLASSNNNWSSVLILRARKNKLLSSFDFYFSLLALVKLRAACIFERNGIDVVAFGDFRSGLCQALYRFFCGKRLWLLDDGIAALNLFKMQDGEIFFDRNVIDQKDMFVAKLFLKKNNGSESVVLKTFLNIDVSLPFVVEKISLNEAFSAEKIKNQVVESNLVYFVGSKFVEEGILTESDYMEICHKAFLKFNKGTIVYFPHREETDELIEKIRCRFGFKIVRPLLPLEFYVCQQLTLPTAIVGVSSAAICTIANIYPHIKVYLIDFKRDFLPENHQLVFNVCHTYILANASASIIE